MAQVQHTFYGEGNPNINAETANLTGDQIGIHHYIDFRNGALWMSRPSSDRFSSIEWVLIYGEDSDLPVE